MVAALILIASFGVALPAALWLFSRWRATRPFKSHRIGMDETDEWLHDEFGLGASDRSAVRRAVLGPQRAGLVGNVRAARPPLRPGLLPPQLLPPARALAARILAGRVRWPGLSRWLGWARLTHAVAYASLGISSLSLAAAPPG